MAPLPSRRKFLFASGKAGLGVYIGLAGASSLASCSVAAKGFSNQYDTGFRQQPLPYAYNALEQAIDAKTMEIHYSKHAAGYATNLQDAAKAEGVDMTRPLEAVLGDIAKYSTEMRNNAGGHYNHEIFWKMMSPNGGGNPTGALATALSSAFNSLESFKTAFEDAAKTRFGSGWAWLYVDNNKQLKIGSTPNQDNPLMGVADIKGYPILGLDVWEHAYYLRYMNKRPEYVAAWWKVVNWDYVQMRYAAAIK